ncbi:Rap guanine nucleotide exchange factor (GEF) 3, partial [Columba livia]
CPTGGSSTLRPQPGSDLQTFAQQSPWCFLFHGAVTRLRKVCRTPLLETESTLDYGHSLTQASPEKIWRAGKLLFTHLTSSRPSLIRDHKHHLRHHRQCCSGKELVDWLLSAGLAVQTRSQAVGICQVLVDGGILTHVKQEWHFQDKDTQFYRFAELELSPEPGAGLRDAEELLEALAFLAQLGPDALLTMALRKPPAQRTEDELELIFEELLHIKAVAHLSNSDVEANTVRLKEHGKVVLVLQKNLQGGSNQPAPARSSRYFVMAGTPEKILEHLLEFMRLDATLYDPVDTLLGDFLLTYTVFMPTTQLCRALLHHFRAEPLEGSEQDKATYSLHKRRKILRLVSQWVLLYGRLLQGDRSTMALLQNLADLASRDPRLGGMVQEQGQERRRPWAMENGDGSLSPQPKARSSASWLASQEEATLNSSCALRAQDKVPYEIYRADHSCLVTVLPVNASVRDVLRSLAPRLGRHGEHVLVKVNSAGDKVGLQPDAVGVFTALGLNERLFAVSVEELGSLPPHPEQLGPHVGSSETLDLISSKDLASHLTDYDWNLFKSIHQVEMIHYIVGPQKFHEVTTANLERVMRRAVLGGHRAVPVPRGGPASPAPPQVHQTGRTPQGAEEPEFLLCGDVWCEQHGRQPPGQDLGEAAPQDSKAALGAGADAGPVVEPQGLSLGRCQAEPPHHPLHAPPAQRHDVHPRGQPHDGRESHQL